MEVITVLSRFNVAASPNPRTFEKLLEMPIRLVKGTQFCFEIPETFYQASVPYRDKTQT